VQGDAGSSLKQLATITPPKVFAAATDARSAASSASAQATSIGPSSHPSSSSSSSSSVLGAADLLGLGAPGCLESVGLQPDPLLESCWRVILNMAVAQVTPSLSLLPAAVQQCCFAAEVLLSLLLLSCTSGQIVRSAACICFVL
jgi:hypothetical protein